VGHRRSLIQLICLATLTALVLPGRSSAELEQRYLWTWDHRMDWAGQTLGRTQMGGGGSYHKPAGEYLEDY